MQEGARKNVERVFKVIQTCWGISWSCNDTLCQLMKNCVVLNTMIVKNEGEGVTHMHDFEKPEFRSAS